MELNSNNEYFIESKNRGRHRRRRLMMIKNPLWSLLIRTENLLTIIFFVQMLTNLSKIVATDEEGIYEWEPDQYPHIRKQGKFCTGSHRNPPTSVCDPDTVLTRDEANELDTLIDNGRNSTLHQCLCEPCDINEAGLAIKIAVVMSVKYKGKNQTLEETLEHFADRVRTNWNVSPKCHHDVLVLVATGYNKVYISMGSKAERAISRSEAKEIIKETLDHFKYGNTYQGLESIVASIISVSDRYDPRLDRFGLRHGLLVTIVGALASLLVIVLLVWFCIHRESRNTSKHRQHISSRQINQKSNVHGIHSSSSSSSLNNKTHEYHLVDDEQMKNVNNVP